MFHRTNRFLGCVAYVYVGRIPFGVWGMFVLVISNINIGFQKSLTLPLNDRMFMFG